MTELICIVCPRGCHLTVDEKNGYKVTGNNCPKGEAYGKTELTNPTRTLTSVVKIENAIHPCCPVKTKYPVPKADIEKTMDMLKSIKLKSPVNEGELVVGPWVVTKSM